jgi:hypothetical protein
MALSPLETLGGKIYLLSLLVRIVAAVVYSRSRAKLQGSPVLRDLEAARLVQADSIWLEVLHDWDHSGAGRIR